MKAKGAVDVALLGIIDAEGRRSQMQMLPGPFSWLKRAKVAQG
jgi:hypothetical protein